MFFSLFTYTNTPQKIYEMAISIAKARKPWSQTCMKHQGIQSSNKRNIDLNVGVLKKLLKNTHNRTFFKTLSTTYKSILKFGNALLAFNHFLVLASFFGILAFSPFWHFWHLWHFGIMRFKRKQHKEKRCQNQGNYGL